MTICVAAVGGNGLIIAASDRMKTGGDIEFEPRKDENATAVWGNGSKIFPLTNSIYALTAGDSSMQSEILHRVFLDVAERIRAEPAKWIRVWEVAKSYISHHDKIKLDRAASAILTPLGLSSDSFLRMQSGMSSDLVARISRDLQAFAMPSVQTILVGVDQETSHILVASNCNDDSVCGVTSSTNTGFAAIGSGARHALSQFMLAGYHRQAPTSETLFQTYLAKKRAEIAPGVGSETDIVAIGPGLGVSGSLSAEIMKGLEKLYEKYSRNEMKLRKKASDSAAKFEAEILAVKPAEQKTDDPTGST